jgi:hypothetical protein
MKSSVGSGSGGDKVSIGSVFKDLKKDKLLTKNLEGCSRLLLMLRRQSWRLGRNILQFFHLNFLSVQ